MRREAMGATMGGMTPDEVVPLLSFVLNFLTHFHHKSRGSEHHHHSGRISRGMTTMTTPAPAGA